MNAIVPYLNFNGNAAEALQFYTTALQGQVAFSQTFGEANMGDTEEMKSKIMHALFKAGDLQFMVSDCPPGNEVTSGDAVSLSLHFEDKEDVTRTYNALKEGGKVTMELQDTFWGAHFGMTKDKFGIHWMFNYDYPKAG